MIRVGGNAKEVSSTLRLEMSRNQTQASGVKAISAIAADAPSASIHAKR